MKKLTPPGPQSFSLSKIRCRKYDKLKSPQGLRFIIKERLLKIVIKNL
jgi:hypothetical protein